MCRASRKQRKFFSITAKDAAQLINDAYISPAHRFKFFQPQLECLSMNLANTFALADVVNDEITATDARLPSHFSAPDAKAEILSSKVNPGDKAENAILASNGFHGMLLCGYPCSCQLKEILDLTRTAVALPRATSRGRRSITSLEEIRSSQCIGVRSKARSTSHVLLHIPNGCIKPSAQSEKSTATLRQARASAQYAPKALLEASRALSSEPSRVAS
jgi:hypothetical protein